MARYGNHHTLIAVRDATGAAELHQHEADVFMVVSGSATLLTGGNILGARTESPGEVRGTGIDGGVKKAIGPGDIVHIPANTPHQLLVEPGKAFAYFVVKVSGQ
jgi:mannose-6-phosphate isomerase-like protein (cupin superfamily)